MLLGRQETFEQQLIRPGGGTVEQPDRTRELQQGGRVCWNLADHDVEIIVAEHRPEDGTPQPLLRHEEVIRHPASRRAEASQATARLHQVQQEPPRVGVGQHAFHASTTVGRPTQVVGIDDADVVATLGQEPLDRTWPHPVGVAVQLTDQSHPPGRCRAMRASRLTAHAAPIPHDSRCQPDVEQFDQPLLSHQPVDETVPRREILP